MTGKYTNINAFQASIMMSTIQGVLLNDNHAGNF